jgi:hypothetical protein
MFSLIGGKFIKQDRVKLTIRPNSDLPKFNDEPMNKLESIAILVSSREINKGLLARLLKNISETTPPNDLDLNIFTNNSNHDPISLDAVKSIFKCVNLVNIDINPEVDIYIKNANIITKTPIYGLVSGPNILFMKAMDACKKYNTTLLLETDCKVFPNWFEKSMNYVSMEYFLVSGSTYDGGFIATNQDMIDYTLRFHLNGVAFYKTGSPVFRCVIDLLDRYIQYMVSNEDRARGYDYFMLHMIIFYTINSPCSDSQNFWKNVMRYMFKTSLIVNVSPVRDSHIPEEDILDVHKQCVILHKKYS